MRSSAASSASGHKDGLAPHVIWGKSSEKARSRPGHEARSKLQTERVEVRESEQSSSTQKDSSHSTSSKHSNSEECARAVARAQGSGLADAENHQVWASDREADEDSGSSISLSELERTGDKSSELVPSTVEWPFQRPDGEVMSIGSAAHACGNCKPCFFVHTTVGCQNGTACRFCHLHKRKNKPRPCKEKRDRIQKLSDRMETVVVNNPRLLETPDSLPAPLRKDAKIRSKFVAKVQARLRDGAQATSAASSHQQL